MKQLIFVIVISLVLFACSNTNEKPAQENENQVANNVNIDSTAQNESASSADVHVNEASKPEQSGTESGKDMEEKAAVTKFTGYVVNLNHIAVGKNEEISGETANKLLSNGQLLGFYSKGQVYLIYNTDGTYASKKLAQIAGKDVTITGNLKDLDGTNYIIAEKFE